MRALIFLILFFINPSCTAKEIRFTQKFKGVDSRLSPYVEDFLFLSQGRVSLKNTDHITMGVEPQPGNRVGVCYYFATGKKEIAIDSDFFENESSLRKKALMYHELAHCICNRDHDHSGVSYEPLVPYNTSTTHLLFFEDGCPKSIMAPEITTTACLEKRWRYYVQEMFEKCTPD